VQNTFFSILNFSRLHPETHTLFAKSKAKKLIKVKIGKELKMPVLFSVEKRTKKDFL
jgi:hypothetical protein